MKNISNKSASLKKGVPVTGGKGHMFGKQSTGQQKPGVSSQEQSKSGGTGAKGGSNKMVGKQTAKKLKPGSPV